MSIPYMEKQAPVKSKKRRIEEKSYSKPQMVLPLGQLKMAEMIVAFKHLADKYAKTKSRWFLGHWELTKSGKKRRYVFSLDEEGNLQFDPRNKETDKLQYEQACEEYAKFLKGGR